MNIKVAAFTVSEKSSNTLEPFSPSVNAGLIDAICHLIIYLFSISDNFGSILLLLLCQLCGLLDIMRFPTMWCVRPAKPQIGLHIRTV